MEQGEDRPSVMKIAGSAASKMENWSPARKEFAQRVTSPARFPNTAFVISHSNPQSPRSSGRTPGKK
jgi:hypothetical protein